MSSVFLFMDSLFLESAPMPLGQLHTMARLNTFFTIKFKFLVIIFQQAFLKTSILEPPEALHIVHIANITKPLWILYQISKLFLNFGQAISSEMTLPHLIIILIFFDFLIPSRVFKWKVQNPIDIIKHCMCNQYQFVIFRVTAFPSGGSGKVPRPPVQVGRPIMAGPKHLQVSIMDPLLL